MPFVQRVVEPKYLCKTGLWDSEGRPRVHDDELEAVTNNTLCNALRQLASLVLVADDIFTELGNQLRDIGKRSEALKKKVGEVEARVENYDPKKVAVPESDICTFSLLKTHFKSRHDFDTKLFGSETRPRALRELYESAAKTPIHLMRQMDRWRRDGHRSSRFFLCTPVLGEKRKRIRNKVDIDIETRMPAAVEELRRWTSSEALGDITVAPDCTTRIATLTDGEMTDGTVASDDEGVDHKLPSPEEQLQVVALKFPAEIVAVDVSGRSFDRMSMQRRSLMHGQNVDGSTRRRTRNRKPRSRRRNTLAGTDQKEIQEAITAGEPSTSAIISDPDSPSSGAVLRSKSSDVLRSATKKDPSPEAKKSHFNSLKQWGKNRLKSLNRSSSSKSDTSKTTTDIDIINIYETVTLKRKRNVDKDRKPSHERNPSASSSEKSLTLPLAAPLASVRLRDSSAQRRLRRSGGTNKDEPHSSSGNWSASSESGRASIGSEITHNPKSTTSTCTSNNSLNLHAPSSVNSRRKFNVSTSTSEGTLTPDIIHDLHEDETSSVYSCDTEGYYTSFHVDSGLKPLKEEEAPMTPVHSTTAFSSGENEYELFGKGSTSTTTSSAGTVCTTLRASEKSLTGPAVPERKSSLNKTSPGSSLERDFSSEKTGTVKRSPSTTKAIVHGDVSPDSGHNTSSSPIESICSPNGVRSGSEFEFSESSDMEGPERIERIRVKTAITTCRIPSMCVITPPVSDDESVKSNGFEFNRPQLALPVDDDRTCVRKEGSPSPSPSGGCVVVKEEVKIPVQKEPIFKASLLPLNSMLGRWRTSFSSIGSRKEKIVSKTNDQLGEIYDSGEYVTIADVRNNNEKSPVTYVNDIVDKNLNNVLSGKIRETEYVSLNELPTETTNTTQTTSDSLERKKRGARVTLDAEGKVIYTSDSLPRRKPQQTTFEPGPHVKPTELLNSPLPNHRTPKPPRPVTRPLSPQMDKLVIRASSGLAEVVRIPPSTIVTPTMPTARVTNARGAYVHVQGPQQKERARPVTGADAPMYTNSHYTSPVSATQHYDIQKDNIHRLSDEYLHTYRTLPAKRTQHIDTKPVVRSVTPDITRGLTQRKHQDTEDRVGVKKASFRSYIAGADGGEYVEFLGGRSEGRDEVDSAVGICSSTEGDDTLMRISPIDPRNTGGFHSSTPQQQKPQTNKDLTSRLLSPKKSTMSNEELYAVIHKSKKKMNIDSPTEATPTSPVPLQNSPKLNKPAETGYLSRNRLSWSPPKNEPRTRQSWACSDRKGQQTSRMDFKKLLLQHGKNVVQTPTKKLSAVEQLKLSKQNQQQPQMNILELSGSPRSLVNRKLVQEKVRTPPKVLSPRAQWRFVSPRSDVLSSPIMEDCREDESPNSSGERRKKVVEPQRRLSPSSVSQRIQAQRAQFFAGGSEASTVRREVEKKNVPPTLETAF